MARKTRRPLEFHPLANIFPLLEGREFEEVVEDVRDHGVREAIWLYEGKILDGRNRYRWAAVTGVPCPTRPYEGDDPLAFVISLNLKRRHLDESQRAMVAAKLATLPHGANQWRTGQLAAPPTQEEAARLLNVGERSVRRAAEVRDQAAPELVHAVEAGAVSVSAAADIATLPLDEQRAILAHADEGEVLRRSSQIRMRKTEERRVTRLARVAAQADPGPLPQNRRWPLLLADPPWKIDASPSSSRAVENHYPTMEVDEIAALPVSEIVAPIAVLFLWAPAVMLPEALQVIEAWGFTYLTGAVWVKPDIGMGHYFRQQHENLLLATRGEMPTPHFDARPPSVFNGPRREHSRKPDEAYEPIEQMYPGLLPGLELFARSRRPNWVPWGNELPPEQGAEEPDHERMLEGLKATADTDAHVVRWRERKAALKGANDSTND